MTEINSQDIFVELTELPSHEQLQAEWLALEARSKASFFTSWAWIGSWLACLPSAVQPRLLRARKGALVVGLGLVVSCNFMRHRILPVKGLFLHSTGDPLLDEITIEYNGFLVDRDWDAIVPLRFFEVLTAIGGDWDEFYLDGAASTTSRLFREIPGYTVITHKRRNYYVDLDAVREAKMNYASLIGKSTRSSIKTSMKELSKRGPITLKFAEDEREALSYLKALKQLHQQYWNSRNASGSFASDFFELFHDTLIRSQMSSGKIQLIRCSAGDHAFAYIYCFAHEGIVYAYQTGIDYSGCTKQCSPGLVALSLAIVENASRSQKIFDFMAGESGYKKALGTASGELDWVVLQRDLLKYRMEQRLRRIKKCFAGGAIVSQ